MGKRKGDDNFKYTCDFTVEDMDHQKNSSSSKQMCLKTIESETKSKYAEKKTPYNQEYENRGKSNKLGESSELDESEETSTNESEISSDDSDGELDKKGLLKAIVQSLGVDSRKVIDMRQKKIKNMVKEFGNVYQKMDVVETELSVDRKEVVSNYHEFFSSVLNQWEADLEEVKKIEIKINNMVQQQMKFMSQMRKVQAYRMESMKYVQDLFIKRSSSLTSERVEKKKLLAQEINKEVHEFHRHLMSKITKQEMEGFAKAAESLYDEL